jgi:hypothetical protein
MEDLKKLYQSKAMSRLKTAYTPEEQQKALADAHLDLLGDDTYVDLYKRTYGRDPGVVSKGNKTYSWSDLK